jgi:hypothetical protein
VSELDTSSPPVIDWTTATYVIPRPDSSNHISKVSNFKEVKKEEDHCLEWWNSLSIYTQLDLRSGIDTMKATAIDSSEDVTSGSFSKEEMIDYVTKEIALNPLFRSVAFFNIQ